MKRYTWQDARRDIKTGLILATLIAPFPILGIFTAPLWAWGIYIGWWALVLYANSRRPHRKARKTTSDRIFSTFQIDDIKKEDEEGAA